jgi:hypothetical protein
MTLISIVFGVIVIVGGIAMAALGGSRDTFMALALLGTGGLVLLMVVKYWRDPTYTDADGKQQKAGAGMLAFLFAIAVVLVAGGAFVMIHGIE